MSSDTGHPKFIGYCDCCGQNMYEYMAHCCATNAAWTDREQQPQQPSPASVPIISELKQRISEMEKQVGQLVGDVQAVVADYTEEKQRREQAETRIKQLEGALQKYGRHQLYCEMRYDPSKCVCGFTDKEKGSE